MEPRTPPSGGSATNVVVLDCSGAVGRDEASATPRAGSGEHYSGFKLSNNFHSLSLVTR